MGNSLILSRKEGEQVDVAFLQQVLEAFPGYIGYAFCDEGAINVDHEMSKQDLLDTLGPEGSDIAFYFAFGNDPIDTEHRQPFLVLEEGDNKPVAAIFLEGSALQGKPGVSAPADLQIASGYLTQKLIDYLADFDNDIDKVVKAFNRPSTQGEVWAQICPSQKDHCEVLIVFPNGKTIAMHKGEEHRSFSWGSSSRTLDAQAKPTAAAEPSAKPMSALEKLKAKHKGATAVTTVTVEPAKVEPEAVVEKKDDGVTSVLPGKGRVNSLNNLGQFYDQFCTMRPVGWEQGLNNWERTIPAPLKGNILKDKKVYDRAKGKGQFIVYNPDEHPRAKVTPSATPAPVGDAASAGDELTPLMTPKSELERVLAGIKKVEAERNNKTSTLILPPALIKAAMASKFPNAIEELGLKSLDDFDGISEDGLYAIYKGNDRAAARMIFTLLLDRKINKRDQKDGVSRIAM